MSNDFQYLVIFVAVSEKVALLKSRYMFLVLCTRIVVFWDEKNNV